MLIANKRKNLQRTDVAKPVLRTDPPMSYATIAERLGTGSAHA